MSEERDPKPALNHLPFAIFDLGFNGMNANTRKILKIFFLWFAILWFAAIVVFESRYLIGVVRQQHSFGAALSTVYEEQIEGINFLILFVYLVPGLFAWFMNRRFRKDY